jgi:hypothetical protein
MIRDEHKKVNYERALKLSLWTIDQAVCYLLNIEPGRLNTDDGFVYSEGTKEQYLDMLEIARLAIALGDLPEHKQTKKHRLSKKYPAILPNEFVQWASSLGYEIPQPFQCLLPEHATMSNHSLPEYYSPDLRILLRAVDRFWKNAAPGEADTQPKKDAVVQWLKGMGFSNSKAETGAAIIRPEWAFRGRVPVITE